MMPFSTRFSCCSDRRLFIKLLSCCSMLLFLSLSARAHNGAVCYAWPVSKIKIDGNLSDWEKVRKTYPLKVHMSDTKPKNAADFSGHFKIAYNVENQSLYVAMEITDDTYLRDESKEVTWNSQDGVELYVDARHLQTGSGVASYLFSKDFKHINKVAWDAASKMAGWDKAEVVMKEKGNQRIYEWRFALDGYVQAGRSLGFDVQVFDRDGKDDFTYSTWGKRGPKYTYPNNLGDVVLMKAGEKTGEVSGSVHWDRDLKDRLPRQVRFVSATAPALYVDVEVDSTGQYTASLPGGSYQVSIPEAFLHREKNIYATKLAAPVSVQVQAGQKTEAAVCTLAGTPVPDLLPAKGVLHDFGPGSAKAVDDFVEAYRNYYQIPGVSLALIKDGKVVYHKTYGVANSMTGTPLTGSNLFEAASVTKPVFAYAVLRLAEKGVIDLEKPLYEYLPNPDIEQDERYKLITAHHVLSHRSGFPNWRWMNDDRKLNLKFTPGTEFGYSGEGFEYLKKVVEKITGKDVEQVLQEEVIKPLGLAHTFFSKNDILEKMAVDGHYDNMPTPRDFPQKPGMAYSMYTEAEAFTTFMLALLNQQGLSEATWKQMLQVQSEYPMEEGDEKPKHRQYMGLSLNVRESPYGTVFGHGGNNGDFRCEFEVYKDLKMGYAVFTNADSAYPFIDAMSDFLIDGK